MAIGRLIRRAAPLIVIGVAGAVAARRRAERAAPGADHAAALSAAGRGGGPGDRGRAGAGARARTGARARAGAGAEPEPSPSRSRSRNQSPSRNPSRNQSPSRTRARARARRRAADRRAPRALEHAPWLEHGGTRAGPGQRHGDRGRPARAGGAGDAIEDATVVEAEAEEEPPDDDAWPKPLARHSSEQPEVGLEVRRGRLTLSGEVERRRGDRRDRARSRPRCPESAL